jgi:hypothetical protein
MKSAILAVRIIGDATSAVAAMDKTASAADKFKAGLGKAALGASAALAAIGVGVKQSVSAAADLEQSAGGVEAVFGSYAGKVKQWSASAAQSVGLSQNSYNELATVIGSQLKNSGVAIDQVAGKTDGLIKLGADLSATYGGTASDAVEALSSALKGEMDPIEKYGISLNQATLQAQAASMGLGDLYKSGNIAAKQQVILAAIAKQSGDAQGQFAAQTGTAAEQQQIANAAWENAQATLGTALLPMVTAVAAKLADMANWVSQNSAVVGPLIAVVAALAAAIVVANTAMSVYATVTTIAAAAQTALSWPILLVVAAIAAVVAIIVVAVRNWGTIQAVASSAAQAISTAWTNFKTNFGNLMNGIGTAASNAWNNLINGASSVVAKVWGFFSDMGSKIMGVFGSIGSAISGAIDAVKGLWGKITGAKSAASSISVKAAPSAMPLDLPMRQYSMSRSIDPTPISATMVSPLAMPLSSYIGASNGRSDSTRPPVEINLDVHDNLDNEGAARSVVAALDSYLKRRGRDGLL